jgi:hypothetical protein
MFTQILWRRSLTGLIAVCSIGLIVNRNAQDPQKLLETENGMLTGSMMPLQVRSILQRACRDCHSDNTVWPWYADVPPISGRVHRDVERGRALMNLSKWSDYSDSERRGFALAILTATTARIMPPTMFVWMHRDARLSDADLREIQKWALAETGAK